MTAEEALDRLFAMMAAWWDGRPLADIAAEHGLSRQRVSQLLAGVGCTEEAYRQADHGRANSVREANILRARGAWLALMHPLAGRLTVRQRSALAWQAQGLILEDIAKRMGIRCQGVQCHLEKACWRLGIPPIRGKAEEDELPEPMGEAGAVLELGPLDTSELGFMTAEQEPGDTGASDSSLEVTHGI